MRILLLSPFHRGSHASWAHGIVRHSQHQVDLLTLAGRHWKWRMHGAAITFAQQLKQHAPPDLLLCTDMLDMATMRGLLPASWARVPMVWYAHENQLSYPWSPDDPDLTQKRDRHYGFINYRSALAASEIWFNSAFHRDRFLADLQTFLQALPDHRELHLIEELAARSAVLPLGLELPEPKPRQRIGRPPVLLWNHRWEYDKNPTGFFEALYTVQDQGIPFELVVLGEGFSRQPSVFAEAKARLSPQIRHWGFVADREAYWAWLNKADLLPVSAHHDFFGISTVEAIAAGVYPLLPDDLAYPAHIPQDDWRDHLYPVGESLARRLIAWLQQPRVAPLRLQEHVGRYHWHQQAAIYDAAFERVVATHNPH